MLAKATQSIGRDTFLTLAASIPNKVKERIPDPLKPIILDPNLTKENGAFFDVHAHSFTIDHVPKNFIKLLNWVSNKDKVKIMKWVDRQFGNLMGLDEPKKVIDNLVQVYDKFFVDQNIGPHLFIVNLCMDMERGISGAPTFNYKTQLEQVLDFIKKESPDTTSGKKYEYQNTILPFLAIDPNNPKALDYFLSGFIENYNATDIEALDNSAPFFGIKLYPCLGYVPEDPVLLDIFSICEAKSIPITTHCGGLRTRTNNREVEIGFREEQNGQITDKKKIVTVHSKANFKNIFLDPLHWERVVKRFPKLKLNIAHFGDNEEWEKFHKDPRNPKSHVFKTLKLIREQENVYADISYSYFNADNRRVIGAMMQMDEYKHKILNGSDFFLTEIEKQTTLKFISDLKSDFKLIPDSWNLLTNNNPYNFLFKDVV